MACKRRPPERKSWFNTPRNALILMPGLQHGLALPEVVLSGIYPYAGRSIFFFVLTAAILIAGTTLGSHSRPPFFRKIAEVLTGNLTVVLVTIAALGFVLRIVAFLRGGVGWSTAGVDSIGYVRLAEGIRAGCGFAPRIAGACGPPDIVRTPGYPAFLAILPTFSTAVVAQSLIAVAASFAIGIAVGTAFGAPAGILAAALLCFEPFSIRSGAKIMSDGLFQSVLAFSVLLELYAVAKGRADRRTLGIALVAGILLAAAILIRPIGLVVVIVASVPFLAMTDLRWRRRILLAACILLAPAITFAGWAERNQQCCGYRTFSAIQVLNLYYYRAGGVLAYETGLGLVAAIQQQEDAAGIPLWRILDAPAGAPAPMTKQLAENLSQRAMAIIRRNPQALIAVTAIRFAFISFWAAANDISDVFGTPSQTLHGGWLRLEQGCFVMSQLAVSAFIWAGFVYAISRSFRGPIKQTILILFPALVGLMLLAAAAGPEADGRLRVAAVPYLTAVGSIGWLGRSREQDGSGIVVEDEEV
jgi:hypothetical protein